VHVDATTRCLGRRFLVTHWSCPPFLSVSARCACHHSLPHDILHFFASRPSQIPVFLFFQDHESQCRHHLKLCRSWRRDTRALSHTFLSLRCWTTARTCSYLAAKMETRCCANGPAIGSARSSDTRVRFGAQSSVAMGRVRHRAVRTLQRASSLSYSYASRGGCS